MRKTAQDIKEIRHENARHIILFNDGAKAEYYDTQVNEAHNYAIGYFNTRTGYTSYKSIIAFDSDGNIHDITTMSPVQGEFSKRK